MTWEGHERRRHVDDRRGQPGGGRVPQLRGGSGIGLHPMTVRGLRSGGGAGLDAPVPQQAQAAARPSTDPGAGFVSIVSGWSRATSTRR